MKTLLLIGANGVQYWQRNRGRWHLDVGAARGPVWAVTDLAEESFAQIQVPRLLGRDRADYLARQLASRFPDTPFRTTLPAPAPGSLLDRLAPTRQLLLGVDASERIQSALNALPLPLAGLWASSMLLAQIGGRKRLPPELFVVLPQGGSLRIVFLKDRQALLSRLAPSTESPGDQAAQIVRTLRHLENTRCIERSERRYPVWFLGNDTGLGPFLSAHRLDLLPPPAWPHKPPSDWRFLLFDLALRSPQGQLAPIGLRSGYLSQRLNRYAYGAAAAGLAVTLGAVSAEWERGVQARQQRDRQVDELKSLRAESARKEQDISSFAVEPNQLRSALNLDAQEVVAVPGLKQAMRTAAAGITHSPELRVVRMNWRVLLPSEPACAVPLAAPPTEAGLAQPMAAPHTLLRRAELKLEVTLDPDTAPHGRARSLAEVSQRLSGGTGVSLLLDPVQHMAQQTLSNSESGTASASWCMLLTSAHAAPENGSGTLP